MIKRRFYRFIFYLFFFAVIFGISKTIHISNNVNGRELPIYSVETNKKQVSLTFDSAWGNEDLDSILNTLKIYNVKATFFITGEWIEKYPEEVKRIYKTGHDVASHGENHKNMSQLTVEECKSEMLTVHRRIQDLLDVNMTLFRPPYGDYDNAVIQTATACGYHTIQWSVDILDIKVMML